MSLSDDTSHDVKPDFSSGKGWAWEKMTKEAMQAGTLNRFPHKPRHGKKEESFWRQVDIHMSRKSYSMGVTIRDGKVIRE